MDTTEAAVCESNRRFYAAFESLDVNQMDAVWLHEDWVECVHPGWELLRGWEEIRESWARIFSNAQRIRVDLSSIWVQIVGDTAWVACTEHVTTSYEEGFEQALVQATNIFVNRQGAWQLVLHHASPLPTGPSLPLQ